MDVIVAAVAQSVHEEFGVTSVTRIFDRVLFRGFPAKITEAHVAYFRLAVGPEDPLGRIDGTFRIVGPGDATIVTAETSITAVRDHGYGVSALTLNIRELVVREPGIYRYILDLGASGTFTARIAVAWMADSPKTAAKVSPPS